MASPTDTRFAAYAGQEVAGGSSVTPYNQPVIDFGDPFNATALANLSRINSLVPRIGQVIIHDTMVYQADLMRIFNRRDSPFGVATEHAEFASGAVNELNNGRCAPTGTVGMVSQLTASNLAWNIPLTVYDREVNGALLSDTEIAAYVAQKMRTMEKTISDLQFNAAKLMISDCVPGKRAITSSTESDGTGTSVSYATTPEGYAGKVILDDKFTIPEIARGSKPNLAVASPYTSVMEAVLAFLQNAEGLVADMRYPGADYNKLGVDTFSGDRPWMIMETKVLNEFDNAIANASTSNGYGYSGFPTKTAREYIARFADLIEIDAFAALPAYDSTTYPTSTDYSGDRLACAIIDKDMPWLVTKWANVEGMRCAGTRSMNYSARGEQDMAMYHADNAAVIIVDA